MIGQCRLLIFIFVKSPFWYPCLLWYVSTSDCQGFLNPYGLRVGYTRVRVRVQISVPATYKTSPRTSETDGNWWRYGPNNRKHHLAHISVISWSFGLIFGGKTRRFAGKGPWGTGTGTEKKPQGYPWQSLCIIPRGSKMRYHSACQESSFPAILLILSCDLITYH